MAANKTTCTFHVFEVRAVVSIEQKRSPYLSVRKKKMVQITPFHLRSAGFSDPGKRSNYFGPGSNVELHSFGTNLTQGADDDDNEAVG